MTDGDADTFMPVAMTEDDEEQLYGLPLSPKWFAGWLLDKFRAKGVTTYGQLSGAFDQAKNKWTFCKAFGLEPIYHDAVAYALGSMFEEYERAVERRRHGEGEDE